MQWRLHWRILGKAKPTFQRVKFMEDDEQILWALLELEPSVSIPTSSREAFVRSKPLFDQFYLSELSKVELQSDNRVRIDIRRYANFFSRFIIRYEGLSFTVDNLSKADYELISQYKNECFKFFNKR
ncbi:hypothetical protein GCM10028808_74160 [Spirosoma migulaei]